MSYQQSAKRGTPVRVLTYAERAAELKRDIDEVEEKTESKLSGRDAGWTRVLLVGVTGGGKTTLLHALLGRKLIAKENETTGLLYYDVDPEEILFDLFDKDQKFTIGNGVESETYIPNVWVDPVNKIIYIDCPGFLDTQTDMRLINAFSMDKVLSNAEAIGANVKVLFVVSEKQLSEKALTARQALTLISKMFPNVEQLRKAVGVVVTKTSPRAKPVGLLEELKRGQADSLLLDKFISDGDQRVFPFPSPYDIGVPTSLFPAGVQEKLFQFLMRDRVSGLKHALAIETDAEKLVIGLGYWFIEDKAKAINLLATNIQEEFSPDAVEDPGLLSQWMLLIERIQESSRMDWKSFTIYCREFSRQTTIGERAVHDMESLVPMEEFIEKVSNASRDAADMIEKNKALIDNALFRFEIIKGNLASKQRLIKGEIDIKKYQDLLLKAEADRMRVEEDLQRLMQELEGTRKGYFQRFVDGVCVFSKKVCDFFSANGEKIVRFVSDVAGVIHAFSKVGTMMA